MTVPYRLVVLCCLVAASLVASPARAQDSASFFKGKTVRLVVAGATGGGFAGYATAIGPPLGRALGATVVVEYLPGAGGLNALNRIAAAEPDGLQILIVNGTLAALSQIIDPANARYDFTRLGLLGIISAPPWVWLANPSGPIRAPTDAIALKTKLRWAAAGVMDGEATGAAMVCEGLKLDCQIIAGYPGSIDAALAVTRGEMDVNYMSEISAASYIRSGQLRPVAMMARPRSRLFPEVPTIFEGARLDADQARWFDFRADLSALGRLLAVPPGMPAERLLFLQDTTRKVLTDPALVRDLAKTPFYLDYQDAAAARRIAQGTVGTMTDTDKQRLAEVIKQKYR